MDNENHKDCPHVYEWARIIKGENLELGDNVEIDDFVFLNAGEKTVIGDNSCLHAGSRVVGGGELMIGRNVAVTYNCVLVTGYPKHTSHMSTRVPVEEKDTVRGQITLRDEAFVGSGAVIMPDVEVGEGGIVAAQSYVDRDVPPWTIHYPNGERRAREPFEPYEG